MSGKIRPNHHSLAAQLQYDFIPGPVKIKDGLFMGDELAAKDVEFLITNKVSHIINTVSRKIPNVWERIGIQYLSFNWSDNQPNVFDKKNTNLNAIFNFIEEAMEDGKSCLVHSVNAKSRSFVVVAAYLMKKYSWSLQKTLDYVGSKKEKLEVRQGFYHQLSQLEVRLGKSVKMTNDWEEAKNQQELVLSNTYKNSKVIVYKDPPLSQKPKKKLVWSDNDTKNAAKYADDRNNYNQGASMKQGYGKLKSILKITSNPLQSIVIRADEPQVQPSVGNTNLMNSQFRQNNGEPQTNNFMSPSQAKPQTTAKKPAQNPLMTRPYSSDAKQRDKKKDSVRDSKKITYDPLMSNFKSPYQVKLPNNRLSTRATRHTVNGSIKKQEQVYRPITNFVDRPQSASNTEKHKVRSSYNPFRDEFVVTNTKQPPSKMNGSSMVTRQPQNFIIGSRDKWRGF